MSKESPSAAPASTTSASASSVRPRVVILGLGALGTLAAHQISGTPDLDLVCVVDADRRARYEKEGVWFNGERLDLNLVTEGEKPDRPADLILYAVKCTHLDRTLGMLEPHVGKGTLVLSELNGVVSEKLLKERYGDRARVLHCIAQGMDARREGRRVTCSQPGCLVIGAATPDLLPDVDRAAALLESAGIVVRKDPDILHRLYAKWMMNVGLNQVVTYYAGTYETVQKPGEARDMMVAAMREAMTVAKAAGVNLTEKDLEEYVALTDSLTPESMPSMRQDALAGYPTEVDFFAGEVLRLAEQCGADVPVNRELFRAITEMDRKLPEKKGA